MSLGVMVASLLPVVDRCFSAVGAQLADGMESWNLSRVESRSVSRSMLKLVSIE